MTRWTPLLARDRDEGSNQHYDYKLRRERERERDEFGSYRDLNLPPPSFRPPPQCDLRFSLDL